MKWLAAAGVATLFAACLAAAAPLSRAIPVAPFFNNYAAPGTGFSVIATFSGIGRLQNAMVGPGASGQRYYNTYLYLYSDFDLLAIDPNTGQPKIYPGPSLGSGFHEFGANLAVGPDQLLYLGTRPHAHFLQFNPASLTYRDLGAAAPSESYIFNETVDPNGKIYACTFPNAKLISYDPATGKSADLGRIDPAQPYARACVSGNDGFIYVGTGPRFQTVFAYQISTTTRSAIVTSSFAGFPLIYRGTDAKVYAIVGNSAYVLGNGQASLVPNPAPTATTNLFSDGRTIQVLDTTVTHNTVTVTNAPSNNVYPYKYFGKPFPVFRLGFGPDGNLYESSILRSYLIRLGANPATLGYLGNGEIYSILPFGKKLLMAGYDTQVPLLNYDPSAPFQPNINPKPVSYPGEDIAWRPEAMIAGPKGLVYIGAIPGYGKLGGPMAVWNTQSNQVVSHDQLIHDESVDSLATTQGEIVGGTTIFGGLGSIPTQAKAHLFIWNPATSKVTFDTVVPAQTITDVIAAPNGLIYGFADAKLMVFDPSHPGPPALYAVPVLAGGSVVHNAIGFLTSAPTQLVALAAKGILFVDTSNNTVALVQSPSGIYGGFALKVGAGGTATVYFSAGANTYVYTYRPAAPRAWFQDLRRAKQKHTP